jgi:hypothetical protein
MSETIQSFLTLLDEAGTKWLLAAALKAMGQVQAHGRARRPRVQLF